MNSAVFVDEHKLSSKIIFSLILVHKKDTSGKAYGFLGINSFLIGKLRSTPNIAMVSTLF